MKALHLDAGTVTALAGPADLAGKTTGTVILQGDPTTPATEFAPWALALGSFALRGGEIRRKA